MHNGLRSVDKICWSQEKLYHLTSDKRLYLFNNGYSMNEVY